MRKNQQDKMDDLIKKGKLFIGFYSGYVTDLNGTTPIEAIKYFYSHYNAILGWVLDVKNETFYVGKENDETDVRGYYNYSYYKHPTNELLFNVDELTAPIVKIKPVKNDGTIEHAWVDREGRIYKCGFECHTNLADELFLSETVIRPDHLKDESHSDDVLNKMGWLKISSKGINYYGRANHKLSLAQKNFIREYIELMGNENYTFQWHMTPKQEILEYLDRH